jgi:NAD+ kinase
MQVAVYSRYLKSEDVPYVQLLFDTLMEKGISAIVFEPYLSELYETITFREEPAAFGNHCELLRYPVDVLITLGGDGTILAASTLIRESKIPILGINLGRLGFMATIGKSQIRQAISIITKGDFIISERNTLWLESKLTLFGETPFALNDFTILKSNDPSMITIHAFINGEYLNSYWADGIILATATGSTGYSLSCGGPIVFPDSSNFVLTPVAPHNLNVRPIVISDSSVVSFKVEGRASEFLCTLDSRQEVITAENEFTLHKGHFNIRMMQVKNSTFPETLRNKLSWGSDMRNH